MRTASPAHIEVGSDLGSVYRDLAGWQFRDGHGYVYLPPNSITPGKPLPVFLFLHGSLGNFKGYLWVLQSLANRRGMAVVAPSFGAGNWNQTGGVETIRQWVRYCELDPTLDGSNIVLAGLSNGGRGVTRAWGSMPGRFRGIICLSPVLEPDIAVAAFKDAAVVPTEPLLVIHGDQDARIPQSHITEGVQLLRSTGIHCDYERFPREDHFLFFSQPEAVLEKIDRWLVANCDFP